MKSRACRTSATIVVVAGLSIAVTGQQGRPPTFRTGVDVTRTTVRVLDADRRPIRGLTAKDFTVFVNGTPQPIVLVNEDEEPAPVTPSAPWMRDVAPDVASNDLVDPRLFVIIMDDATPITVPTSIREAAKPSVEGSKSSPYQIAQARGVARAIVDQLGPNDLASIVFSGDNRGPQDLTGDRARLFAAIDRYHPTELPGFTAREYSRNVIQMSLEFLRQTPERRSVILWVSDGFPGAAEDILPLGVRVAPGTSTSKGVDVTGSTNVPVFTVSTQGFTGRVPDPWLSEKTIPFRTGGRAIEQTNTPIAAVPGIFEELRVSYTIGFQQAKPEADGRFRRVEVRVNRPGALVMPGSTGYFPPSTKQVAAAAAMTRLGTPTTLALSGIVPLTDERLRLAVAPFAADAARPGLARVAVALGVDLEFVSRTGDTVDLELRVFDAEGRKEIEKRTESQRLRPRGGRDRGEFDLLATLALKPGRYNIRVAMNSTMKDSAGSVYSDFVVPDFASEKLSLSGLILGTIPEKPSLPTGALRDWLPMTPTTTRVFGLTDRVESFLRVYVGDAATPPPVAMAVEIRDEHDAVVWTKSDSVTAAGARPPFVADYRLALPTDKLGAGEFLLSIAATATDAKQVRRQLRFSVR